MTNDLRNLILIMNLKPYAFNYKCKTARSFKSFRIINQSHDIINYPWKTKTKTYKIYLGLYIHLIHQQIEELNQYDP